MYVAPFPLPAHIFLAEKAQRDHQELQVEPVVTEPQEQVDAEDDREGSEAQYVIPATRP